MKAETLKIEQNEKSYRKSYYGYPDYYQTA